MKVTALDHLVLTVANLEDTVSFYQSVLGMEPVSFRGADGAERTALCFGVQKINLHAAEAPILPHAGKPVAGSADLCLLSDVPLCAWLEHLSKLNVTVELGPVDRTGAVSPLVSLYIRDPDGNLIEISNPK
ncbi:VOC family protein [Pelagovum sp. HNIBRBA483]|uniref:VOC family protein n=1 Tax=Pelagovum sp. HNIBRBA483 TaxID=3233341 RepID=UPI0034A125E7